MTMIERVARAISKSEINDERGWEAFLPEARAAIEAMREPTSETKAAINSIAGPVAVAYWLAGHETMINAALASEPA
ncbi:hypothetical protein [Limoniibacter endophyticus]|uniref:Uncharacterized protein n=1 Tax=Limoniibacter endophyticus TaxID=1565040 RepID=A0A8J3GFX7_9HYPH|nr:hypothetical protein [Limoniibacter endophyticus]GHC61526.1 hypothetical protein GCM10010136_02120 [Limoniibacter endophyticus]